MFEAMKILKRLLDHPAPVRPNIDVDPEISSVLEVVTRSRIETLATVADGTASDILRAAIVEGRDIQIIGCSPFDIHLDRSGWSARAIVIIEGDRTRLRMIIEGAERRPTACRVERPVECAVEPMATGCRDD